MPEKQKEKLYYRPDELMGVLPFGRSVIYRELGNGTIPSIRVGRKFLIPRAALVRWLDSAGVGIRDAA